MWLINTTTLKLEFFVDLNNARPHRYAILSHTWEEEEVSFQEFQDIGVASLKKGFEKILMTCKLALARRLEYAWVDTCCIDKTNNVELTEAINSMFLWYKESEVCFAYLSDLEATEPSPIPSPYFEQQLSLCRWFTRGWTLQELIAPQNVEFLDSAWSVIGHKFSLVQAISTITGIDEGVLLDSDALKNVAVARKMSWAAIRMTTRVEDMAYCLIGIFDVNMPMIYGEGHKAFYRLQEQIAKETNDLSLFAWRSMNSNQALSSRGANQEYRGIFANSPPEFENCSSIQLMPPMDRFDQEFAITNKGLRLEAVLAIEDDTFVLNLQCFDATIQSMYSVEWLGIYLTQTPRGFVRSRPNEFFIASRTKWHFGKPTLLYVPRTITAADSWRINGQYAGAIGLSNFGAGPFQVMTARPESLWDPSKGLFLAGKESRFTGYLHMRCISEGCPAFEFIVVCGRRHINHHTSGAEPCVFEYWCAMVSESCQQWADILEITRMANRIADVPSLDHLYQSLHYRPLLTYDDCEILLPSANFHAKISIHLRSGTCRDLSPSLAKIDGECQCIHIACTISSSRDET